VPAVVSSLDELTTVSREGWPVAVEVAADASPDAGAATLGAQAVAIERGARLLVAGDVRGARRVAAVVAELLRARDRAQAAP
jgi:hypothetical protein